MTSYSPGHHFEDNPFDEGTTRRGTDTPGYRPEKPAGTTQAAPDVSGRSWARRYVEWSSRLLRRVELKGWAGLAWPAERRRRSSGGEHALLLERRAESLASPRDEA